MATRYRRIPFEYYEVENMESWMSSLGEQGLYPVRVYRSFGFVRCEKGEPMPCRVRMEPAQHVEEEAPEELCDIYEASGWEYIGTIGQLFHVFRTFDAAAPEPHTDPQLYAETMRHVVRRSICGFLITDVIMLIACIIVFGTGFDSGEPMLDLLDFGIWKLAYFIALLLSYLIIMIRQIVSTVRFYRKLKRGELPNNRKKLSRFWVFLRRTLSYLVILLAIGWYILGLAETGWNDAYGLSPDAQLPFPTMYDTDPNVTKIGGFRANGTDYANFVSIERDILVTHHYYLSQSGEYHAGDNFRLMIDCYLSPYLSINARIAADLTPDDAPDGEILWSFGPRLEMEAAPEGELLWGDDTQYIRYYTGTSFYDENRTIQCLIICTDERAAFVRYDGDWDLRKWAMEFAGLEESK